MGRANAKGWRDRERSYDNSDARYRILVMGDSQVFGYTVPEDAQFTRRLEDRLRREETNAEVINISYPGWSIDQQLVAFRREGIRYRPDMASCISASTICGNCVGTRTAGNMRAASPSILSGAPTAG